MHFHSLQRTQAVKRTIWNEEEEKQTNTEQKQTADKKKQKQNTRRWDNKNANHHTMTSNLRPLKITTVGDGMIGKTISISPNQFHCLLLVVSSRYGGQNVSSYNLHTEWISTGICANSIRQSRVHSHRWRQRILTHAMGHSRYASSQITNHLLTVLI